MHQPHITTASSNSGYRGRQHRRGRDAKDVTVCRSNDGRAIGSQDTRRGRQSSGVVDEVASRERRLRTRGAALSTAAATSTRNQALEALLRRRNMLLYKQEQAQPRELPEGLQ